MNTKKLTKLRRPAPSADAVNGSVSTYNIISAPCHALLVHFGQTDSPSVHVGCSTHDDVIGTD